MVNKVPHIVVFMIAAAAFVVIVAGMQAATAIINPFLLAIFLASIFEPLLYWLQQRRVPNGLAVSVIILVLLVVGSLLLIFLGRSLNSIALELPQYQERIGAIIAQVVARLNKLGLDLPPSLLFDYITPQKVMRLVFYGLSMFRSLFTNMFLILLTVFFILLEASGFPRKLQTAFPEVTTGTWEQFRAVTANVNQYMGLKALTSLATGFLIWISLVVIGVDFAGTWGVLAFFLNFIPAIGSIIAAIPAILWALVQLGLTSALLTTLAYLVVNLIIGNLLEPKIMGEKLGLSTLVVFLSMIFWGWVLGPVGMLLSVPLTMITKIALATNTDTRWIAVILE